MPCLVILNEPRRVFVWNLIFGNTLELDKCVLWKTKVDLNGSACSLKSDIILTLWKIVGIIGILFFFRNQLRIDQENFCAVDW